MKKQKNYPLYPIPPFESAKDVLEIALREVPDKAAFKYRYEKEILQVTYRRFKEEVDTLAAALCALDLDRGHLAVVGENSYRWVNIFFSVLCSRGTLVPIDRELPPDEMLNILDSSDSEIVFYSHSFDDFINENKDKLSKVRKFIRFDSWKPSEPSEGDVSGRFIELESLAFFGRTAEKAVYETSGRDPEAVKLLVYTSGTTGVAKGVMLTMRNITSCVFDGVSLAKLTGSCLSVLPYHHTYASVCDLIGGLHSHVTVCINEGIRAVPMNLKEYKPDYIFLVPRYLEVFYERIWSQAERTGKAKLLRAMLKVSGALMKIGIDLRRPLFKSVREAFGGNLKMLLSGGALLRSELGDFFESIGLPVVIGYGITECSPLVCANRNEFYDVRTVGLPLPCLDIKIDSPTDEGIGEICVKGPTVMKGYYKNEEATREAIRDGWFYTGDYGMLNEKGQVSVTGRKKNVIVLSNGKNVYPEEIENYIETIPEVCEVVVYSMENASGDESALCAEVYLNPETSKGLEDKVKFAFDKIKKKLEKLPSYKQIRKVVVRDTEFEKTTTKKIKRNAIKKVKA